MQIPNAEESIVDEGKIRGYLLADDHPDGGSKAQYFKSFGFTDQNWRVFTKALRDHALLDSAVLVGESQYGHKYRVNGPLSCPDGRSPLITTVWIIEQSTAKPRLVTAYPS